MAGYNPISNGNNTNNQWRTLTQPEWDYVINTRSTISDIRYAKANVNGMNGVILLPDDWNNSNYNLNNTNSPTASFSSNTLSASLWTILESAGAVFLPAAGHRFGNSSILEIGSHGYYWTASYGDNNYALFVDFSDYNVFTGSFDARCNGQCVRLVHDASN